MGENRCFSYFARLARAFSFPGKDRLMRLVYSPDKRTCDFVTEIIPYDEGLIRVTTSFYLEWFLYLNRYYEAHVTQALKSTVKEDSVCLDVGANIGCHTLTMAHRAPYGRVYAFEPNPATFERLMFNIRLNNLKNVSPLNLAISHQTGVSSFFVPDQDDCNQSKSSMIYSKTRGVVNEISVKAAQVKDIPELNNLAGCDLIKIDVEGYELICLKELGGVINQFLPVIIFEYDPQTWGQARASLEEVEGILPQYNLFDLADGQPISGERQTAADVLGLPH
jgi:FkbM family methyltransferase